jgi:hypothetical protein
MNKETHYGTVTGALREFAARGFVTDYNKVENRMRNGQDILKTGELMIVDVFRYEGNTDPADEASVYALESKEGEKGVIVTGYGISADSETAALLARLKRP